MPAVSLVRVTKSSAKKTTYSEFAKRQTSAVWDYFTAADDRKTAKCKLCGKIIKTGGGSTKGMHTHINTIHKSATSDHNAASTSTVRHAGESSSSSAPLTSLPRSKEEPMEKKTKLTDYYQSSDSMESVVARMAALDGIPLSKFCTSRDLRRLFIKSGYSNLPRSPTSITNIVLRESDHLKTEMKRMIADLKDKEYRFSLTFDEYTNSNKRYMNINIHNKDMGHDKFKNLGLVKIEGSLNAEAGLQYLQDRLQDFGLTLSDIIAFTTDGASVMTKLGRNFEGHHQLCMAHGIQLAVIDVLYKFKFEDTTFSLTSCSETGDSDTDEDDQDHTNEEDSINMLPPMVSRRQIPEFIYKELIEKVRKIIRLFRKSPTKNDVLQKHVAAEKNGKTLQLILDCKTRWSSMSDMVGRFLELKSCVSKALIDLKINMPLDEADFQILENIHNALAVVKATVLALCRRDANLITADAALNCMLKASDDKHDDLSKNLAAGLRKRIKERRTVISGVLQYLDDNEIFYEEHLDEDTFKKPTSNETHAIIVSLLARLQFKNTQKEQHANSASSRATATTSAEIIETECSSNSNENSEYTFETELEKEISKSRMPRNIHTIAGSEEKDLDSIVRVEMCVYDSSGGGREVFLTAAYEYLLSVVPTSVESERVFSSVGYLCNRLRSSLSENTLNALSFLRSHYQNEQK